MRFYSWRSGALLASTLSLALGAACTYPPARVQLHNLARAAGFEHRTRTVRVNDRMATMNYRTLDGASVTLGSDNTHTYVFNVFTTWCGYCREEAPALSALARRLQARGVLVYGIDQGEDAQTVRRFVREASLPYPVVLDGDHTSSSVFGTNLIPTTVVVRNGIVRAIWSGPPTDFELQSVADEAS